MSVRRASASIWRYFILYFYIIIQSAAVWNEWVKNSIHFTSLLQVHVIWVAQRTISREIYELEDLFGAKRDNHPCWLNNNNKAFMITAVENISKRRKDASIKLITFYKTLEKYLAFSKIKPTSDEKKHVTASIKRNEKPTDFYLVVQAILFMMYEQLRDVFLQSFSLTNLWKIQIVSAATARMTSKNRLLDDLGPMNSCLEISGWFSTVVSLQLLHFLGPTNDWNMYFFDYKMKTPSRTSVHVSIMQRK